uniref:INCENP_ARK-bind domain-containing protein n=1 Tax=Parastrongyloides trichosuri TaxID=131310 RepID=A0A0N4Z905_PARTI
MSLETNSSLGSTLVSELPDVLKNLLAVIQNESASSNDYLIEIEMKIRKKVGEENVINNNKENVVTEETSKKKRKKKNRKNKKDETDNSKKKKKKKDRKKKKHRKKETDLTESTAIKTLKTRSSKKSEDDDMVDSDDRYPDESLEKLPYLTEEQREMLRTLRQQQIMKCCKKSDGSDKTSHHVAESWNPPSSVKGSSQVSSNAPLSTSSFRKHYPYVPRKNSKPDKTTKKLSDENKEKSDESKKEVRKPKSSQNNNNKSTKKKKPRYVNAADIWDDDEDILEDINNDETFTQDMYKIFK